MNTISNPRQKIRIRRLERSFSPLSCWILCIFSSSSTTTTTNAFSPTCHPTSAFTATSFRPKSIPSTSTNQIEHHLTDVEGDDDDDDLVHTLILCRHGDSIWNGGEPGCQETFTGWTDVPLSQKGIQEAIRTGQQVAEYSWGIDACLTSILQRAQLTAHYCLWGFGEKPFPPSSHITYIQDYRLNERHYGALQGFVKEEVQAGKYGHDASQVKLWRRSWSTVPPLLTDDDPRRIEELRKYSHHCGGELKQIPRGESLEQVAEQRIRPFLQERLLPLLEQAAKKRRGVASSFTDDDNNDIWPLFRSGGTALIVAHANSLRALMGVLCHVQQDPVALEKLEALRLQTGVPLVMRFRSLINHHGIRTFQPCDLDGIPVEGPSTSEVSSKRLVPELPVYPLSSIPRMRAPSREGMTTAALGNRNRTTWGTKPKESTSEQRKQPHPDEMQVPTVPF